MSYKEIKQLLINLGYTKITEDIEINGDLYFNFYNPETKKGINITYEDY